MEQPVIISRVSRTIRHTTKAFREGYNRDTGIHSPKILNRPPKTVR